MVGLDPWSSDWKAVNEWDDAPVALSSAILAAGTTESSADPCRAQARNFRQLDIIPSQQRRLRPPSISRKVSPSR